MSHFHSVARRGRLFRSTNMGTRLEVIGLKDIQEFQQLYKQNWPKYCQEYYCLDNFVEFLKKQLHMRNIKMYTLDAKQARDEGLFVIVVSSTYMYRLQLTKRGGPLLGSLSTIRRLLEQHERPCWKSSGFTGLVVGFEMQFYTLQTHWCPG